MDTKKVISKAVNDSKKEKQLSLRKMADKIPNLSYTQINRITTGKNYTIDTLTKVLDLLDLEIVIKKKGDE